MPRYFFHVRNGHKTTYQDDVGRRLDDVQQAKIHADFVAEEFASDAGWAGYSVVIVDDHGNEIGSIEIGATSR